MRARLALNAKLLLSFAVVTTAMVFFGVYLIDEVRDMSDLTTELYSEGRAPVADSLHLETDTLWANLAVRRYTDAPDDNARTDARALFDEHVNEATERLSTLLEGSGEEERQRLTSFEEGFTQLVGVWEQVMALAEDDPEGAAALNREQAAPLVGSSLELIAEAVGVNEEQIADQETESNVRYASARNAAIVLLLVVAVVTMAGAWLLARSITNRVGGSARSVTNSADELATTSSQMSSTAEETAAQAGVVSAAGEQVSHNVATASADLHAIVHGGARNGNTPTHTTT
jgi:hypothetical protein